MWYILLLQVYFPVLLICSEKAKPNGSLRRGFKFFLDCALLFLPFRWGFFITKVSQGHHVLLDPDNCIRSRFSFIKQIYLDH